MADPTLAALAADYWDLRCELHPTQATALGVPGHNDRLPDWTPAGRTAAQGRLADLAARVGAIGEDRLGGEDLLTRSVLHHAIAAERARLEADATAYTVDVMAGPQSELFSVPSYQPLATPKDGEALLARWRAMEPYLETAIANLQRGLDDGRLPIATSVDRVVDQLRAQLDSPLEAWSLMTPLAADHHAWPDASWHAFEADLREVVDHRVRPALVAYLRFVEDRVRGVARDQAHAGVGHLPGGEEIYARAVAAHTTTSRTPQEIHAIGRAEVERIDAELAELGARVLGATGLEATQRALRSDPAMHFTSRDEVRDVAVRSLARAYESIPAWFGRLPMAPCEVVPMLPHEERHSTIAYYREPASDGSRPGQYYINTSEPMTRPRYEAEALAFHEAVPGHHLQIAIAQEIEGLPTFRRFSELTAYVEGWGLYTERLSDEMGLYSGDLDRIGMLSFDAWRACRLVVDTGMHALGWSRAEAISFMTDHSALATNNIANEVDRYLAWPGQALAYKIGQLEIVAIRADAQARLGSAFDIRRFHDAVLTHGALPLDTLSESVARDL